MIDQNEICELRNALVTANEQILKSDEKIWRLETALTSLRRCLISANDVLLYKDGTLSQRKAVVAAINHINAGLLAVIPRESALPQSAVPGDDSSNGRAER